MGLNYPGEWKFESIGIEISTEVDNDFLNLIKKIADSSHDIIEVFKKAFGGESRSTGYGWAVSDLSDLMSRKKTNGVEYIDCLWSGIENARNAGCKTPAYGYINRILNQHEIPLKIELPNLISLKNVDTDITDVNDDNKISEDKYVIIEENIGNGGYGIVHKAERKTSVATFEYAIKILNPSLFVENHEKALRRFQKEVQAIQVLQHKAIIQYLDGGVTSENKPYIVMPFIDGEDLLNATIKMNKNEIVNAFIEILGALEYAHSNNVIHRDLKPKNIIIRKSDRQPIILDFGAAFILDDIDTNTLTTNAVGTFGYIPSEVITDPKKRSPLQDVYACGIMLYESFAGRKPDPQNYRSLREINEEYAIFDTVIQQAIAGEEKRIKTAGEFVELLKALN